MSGPTLYGLVSVQALNAASAGRVAAAGLFGSAEGLKVLDGHEALAGLRDRADYRAFRAALGRTGKGAKPELPEPGAR